MAKRKGIDGVDKTRIIALLKNVPVKVTEVGNLKRHICLQDFLNERDKDKYSYDDVLKFLIEQTIKCLNKEYSRSTFPKYLYSVCAFIDLHIEEKELTEEEFEELNLTDPNESKNEFEDKKYLVRISPLDKSLYLEIKKIKPLYEEFKANNLEKYFENEEETKVIDELIEEIEEVVEKVSPNIKNKLENKEDSNDTAIDMLQELNDEIKELKTKVKELEKENAALTLKNSKLDKTEKKLRNDIQDLKTTLKDLEQKYEQLQKEQKKQLESKKALEEIEKLKEKIEQLENEKETLIKSKKNYEILQASHQTLTEKLKNLQEAYDKLQRSNDGIRKHRDNLLNKDYDYEKLQKELAASKNEYRQLKRNYRDLEEKYKTISIGIETAKAITSTDVINKHIQKIIIENLLQKNCSLNELINILKINGYSLSIDELNPHISTIKKELKVITTNYNDNIPTIGIDLRAKINGTLKLDLPCNNTSRILIISNSILNREPDNLLKIIEDIYDYCIKNSIHYIFNIGNLFNTKETELLSIDELKNLQKQLEIIIHKYPLDSSINNILLGSTNDLNIIKYGIDPIEKIASERLDFCYLGYKTGKIEINNPDNKIFLNEPIIDCHEDNQRDKIIEYLTKYKNIYDLRIFGSNFDSIIDTTNNFITIPPLYNSEILNGATELDITFNSSGDIEEVLCIPLIIDDILIPTAHVYIKK